MNLLSALFHGLGGLLYPPYCTVCGAGTQAGSGGEAALGGCGGQLCEPCAKSVEGARAAGGVGGGGGGGGGSSSVSRGRACIRCSRVFLGAISSAGCCAECLRRRPAFGCAVAPFLLRGALREVVHQFKYQGKRHLRFTLAGWLAEGLGDPRLRAPPPEVLVPVPLHWRRQFARGFNQAELLAHALAELSPRLRPLGRDRPDRERPDRERPGGGLRLPVEGLLQRVRDTGTQTVLSRGERLGNLKGAFALGRGALVSGRHVLLVDDVLTTGATLDACARVLLSAGAASVRALSVARG